MSEQAIAALLTILFFAAIALWALALNCLAATMHSSARRRARRAAADEEPGPGPFSKPTAH